MDAVISQSAEISNFFSFLQAKRESFTEFMKLYEPSLAPYFNLFEFIGPDENRLSDIIAFFLDPKAGHGQGDSFLRVFLGIVGLDHLTHLTGAAVVIREKTTETIERSQRRLDIEISFGIRDFGIGIENKPWAPDQDDQIKDYSEALRTRYNDKYLLIYLPGSGMTHLERSISQEDQQLLEKTKHFTILPYRDLIPCVTSFKNHCQSERVRFFLQEFENYLRKKFGGEQIMYEKEIIIENIMSNSKNLELALTIAQYHDDIKLKLLNENLQNSLKAKFLREYDVRWDISNLSDRYQWFGFHKKSWGNHWIAFQFEGSQANGLIYGVFKELEDLPDNLILKNNLKEKLKEIGIGKSESEWLWYENFEEPFYNWSSSYEPWVEILKDNMVNKFKVKIDKLAEVLDGIENV